MKLKFIFILLILQLVFSTSSKVAAQGNWNCNGQVVDAKSGEPLIGANIFTADYAYGTTSDSYGRYTLKVPKSMDILISSYIGYELDTCFQLESPCYFRLKTEKLKEVVVSGRKPELQKEMGQFTPSMKQIERLPALLGDVDILKALTMLPGVSRGVEGSSGLVVRGGNLSHNLILLDGIPVYNSNHLFGFMSSFNPDAIKHVKLYKGGFPAEYGGRLASILNITMKDGDMKKYRTKVSLGIINSSIVSEGPILKDRISYMLAGRFLSLSPFLALANLKSDGTAAYWVYDLNAKLKVKLTKRQNLYISYLEGQDNFKAKEEKTISNAKWGNRLASLRYHNQLMDNLFLDAGLYYNRYLFSSGSEEQIRHDQGTDLFFNSASSMIEDYSAKLKAKLVLSPKFRISFGGEYSQKKFMPVDFYSSWTDSLGIILNEELVVEEIPTRDVVLYLDNEYQIWNQLKLKLGVRGVQYKTDGFVFNGLDLRSSVSYKFGKNTIKLAYDEMNQPFHLLSTVGDDSPNEIWIPGIASIPPSKSKQLSIGYSIYLNRIGTQFSLELFTKKMTDLVRYKPGSAYVFSKKDDWKNNVIENGFGNAKGIEFLFNKSIGKFSGWLGYTLSVSNRKYQKTNKGNWFPSNYDRRHDLEVTANYSLSKKWKVASAFALNTGRPLTLPSAYYLVPREPSDVVNRYEIVFDKINGSRTALYHRLDLSFNYEAKTKRNRDYALTFGVYNVYARNNPFSYTTFFKDRDENRNDIDPRILLFQKSYFNLIPSINYQIKF